MSILHRVSWSVAQRCVPNFTTARCDVISTSSRIKMAEAAVDHRPNKFYCHRCSTDINPTLPVSVKDK